MAPSRVTIPRSLPLLFVEDNVLLPGVSLKIALKDRSNILLLKDFVLKRNLLQRATIGVLPRRFPDQDGKEELVGQIGTAGYVTQLQGTNYPELNYNITVTGLCRFVVEDVESKKPYVVAIVEQLDNIREPGAPSNEEITNLAARLRDIAKEVIEHLDSKSTTAIKMKELLNSLPDHMLPDILISVIKSSFQERLQVLNSRDVIERFKKALPLLLRQLEESGKSSWRERFSIRKPGKHGDDEEEDDLVDLESKIKNGDMPEYALKEALKELKRLKRIPPHFPDHAPIRHYLEWMVDLPWHKHSEDSSDISKARKDLDNDHYGLKTLKKRVIEYLAVKKLKNSLKGPILCFVGPPGVGKTSVGKSIANTLGRKFQRISLGGICDQSDIRGHRRTYIGSMPGRILTALKNSGTKNPLILLDEIDKLGKGIHGDPAAALLEVLDPEQNNSFTDHYLNIPFDLSEVLFIATANTITTIPSALLDRMEVIEIEGYTVEEKVIISSRHLVPKQIKEHGLKPEEITIPDATLKKIVTRYTREAGVRSLERKIGAVCRVLAVKVADVKTPEGQTVEESMLDEILGPPIFESEVAQRLSVPGVAVGLAWTIMGGEIMFVEATKMGGEGKLSLTGQLGDVMKESAQLALSWIRSHAVELGFAEHTELDIIGGTDLHLHFPAGAVGKDGPSAGVTIVTALVSLFSGCCVRSDTAMTGEVTLRGLVLPVGGVREKVLAAHRASIKRIILPERNVKDLKEIPQEIKDDLEIITVTRVEEVLHEALEGGLETFANKLPDSKL